MRGALPLPVEDLGPNPNPPAPGQVAFKKPEKKKEAVGDEEKRMEKKGDEDRRDDKDKKRRADEGKTAQTAKKPKSNPKLLSFETGDE